MSIGIAEERILDGTPEDLKPFLKADRMRRKARDEEAWLNNQYTMIAVSVAVQRSLYGKKSKIKYLEKPLSELSEEKEKQRIKDENLTEEEKKQQRNNVLLMLQTMQFNFNKNHNKKEKAGE